MFNLIKLILKYQTRKLRVLGKQKIFCIGCNKTGTTSFEKAFKDLGYILGSQVAAEKLLYDYGDGKFDTIIKYCHSAQVFQDFPFSFPETFKHLDKAYPNSKFVLTVRDNPEQWYNSYLKFQPDIYGNGKLPTKEDLQNMDFLWKGWAWDNKRILYNPNENDVYNKDKLVGLYTKHNKSVKEYFKNRPDDLIVINVAEKGSYQRLMDFLNIDSPYSEFPWENKSK